jgi:hypothetical protein
MEFISENIFIVKRSGIGWLSGSSVILLTPQTLALGFAHVAIIADILIGIVFVIIVF